MRAESRKNKKFSFLLFSGRPTVKLYLFNEARPFVLCSSLDIIINSMSAISDIHILVVIFIITL